MRDRDDRDLAPQPADRRGHERFGLRVERARRLVEHEHERVAVERAGDAEALALAAREREAALADASAQAALADRDDIPELRPFERGAHLVEVDLVVLPGERDILRDRAVEERDVLRHVADARAPGGQHVFEVLVVERDRALLRHEEAEQHVDHRRLAGARRADEGERAADGDLEVDVMQGGRVLVARVGERDVVEPQHLGRAHDGIPSELLRGVDVDLRCLDVEDHRLHVRHVRRRGGDDRLEPGERGDQPETGDREERDRGERRLRPPAKYPTPPTSMKPPTSAAFSTNAAASRGSSCSRAPAC